MRAAQWYPDEKQLKIVDIPIPALDAIDVLVKIKTASLCHSDLIMIEGKESLLPFKRPSVTIGHEACGVIEKCGPDVKGYAKGDKVGFLVYYHPCYECHACSIDPIFCAKNSMCGFTCDGFFAEYARIDSRSLVRIPDDMDLTSAAPLFCAGLTSYNAVHRCGLKKDQWLAICGLGGLGHLGLQYAKKRGYRVIGIDISDAQTQHALELGAEAVFNPRTDQGFAAKIKQFTDGGVHAVAVMSDSTQAYADAPTYIRLGGTLMVVGLAESQIKLDSHAIAMGAYHVKGSSLGDTLLANECINFSHMHHIVPRINKYTLDDIHEIVERMKKGESAEGRMVVVF